MCRCACSAVQCSAVQCSAVQCSDIRYHVVSTLHVNVYQRESFLRLRLASSIHVAHFYHPACTNGFFRLMYPLQILYPSEYKTHRRV
ncbi:hypothetical protein PF005_g29490 [Phytophthora fragariae]|uniref:Uncharacterized protein n=1 Tax=Phytophthora fragariae TaxID=53985 RepID=A0A6A4B2U0_9STRA|nr:hypothetical protein PF009_g30783 [Phytophthora fragariae]KAE9060433.1 hypothetical protein PF010_g30221 [Phytophthora fragariae]KAE9066392.1 hypothetical protein PF006_g30253 [Phytophthora fragariae]KAE9074521.1 hypothetical protein PF007_g25377 [Phytophthora fragariae]KAE9165713.1 hypothetical protein PF005_g29490 [Phytophthora fragariae]